MAFIKRDKFDYIVNTIIPDICSRKRLCEFFSIFHLPGCGGTTLVMHVLWTLKDKFRCAVLKDTTDITDYTTVAKHVVQLLIYETKEKPSRLPVLLMIDNFQDISDVKKLQLQIEDECLNQRIFLHKSPQVIIVNCMRIESSEQYEVNGDAICIQKSLSEKEQKLFDEKLKDFKRTNTNTETFHGFMILKNNFSPDYIQCVVKNTLKGFNFQDKHAQLFAVLVLLHVYSRNALLSVSTCKEFLGLETKADSESCKVEDGFQTFSTLVTRCKVVSNLTFEGMRVIHSSIAQHCLEEFSDLSPKVTKADITNFLLTTELFYKYTLGKQKLKLDVRNMLVGRQCSVEGEDSLFSPLIQDIMKETPEMEGNVLKKAERRYGTDPLICQLLAKYYYSKNQDFTMALEWAKKAKDRSSGNLYICQTISQVCVHKLQHDFCGNKDDPIKADILDEYLTLAESAAEACKETQQMANKETMTRMQRPNDYKTYNTAGHLGELQTAATIIEILQKTTLCNCLGQVLLGKMTIEELSKKSELKQYYYVLQKHKSYLLQLKDTMKDNFTFIDNFFVNLVPFFAERDKQKELTKPKMSSYFQQYTDLFCTLNTNELVKNEHMNHVIRVEKTRQCLERNNANSYTGILEYLYKKCSASTLENIIKQYDFILRSKKDSNLMDTVNFLYANVILAKIKPKSRNIKRYGCLCTLLRTIIHTTSDQILPLHYITVLLLWQETNHRLPIFVSQMKKSYSTELKLLSNGKRAAVHFYLGKGDGYAGLLSNRDVNSCLGPGQDISTQWDDKKIWKQVRDSKKLCRVSGEICKGFISVEGIKVDPMFRSQLSKEPGTRVSFFIGFSMNGPVALDIDFESKIHKPGLKDRYEKLEIHG
ncbi:hypothetical protein QQF64_026076 [Cirrhinus molitorella]|uniref:Sterile alpha motif domain-containing protein 9-like n=1 Tax=Cirrhinus molitorella TaxID=172907 RepID=A0ABR3NQV0_9TELE